MLEKIQLELNKLQKIKNQIANGLQEIPEGKLRCRMCGEYPQYYVGNKYIRKENLDIARILAQYEYDRELQQLVDTYEKQLVKLQKLYKEQPIEQLYRKMHPGRKKLVEPHIQLTEQVIEEFEQQKHEGKKFAEDDRTEYYTAKGERVRSKSEKIIADELFRNHVPYQYELPIELESWNKKIVVYPDFTALNRKTGKKWWIEHLGMMDQSGYYEAAMKKLDLYEKNGILLGRDLLIFHETASNPINTRVMEKYIEEYL